MSEEFDKYVHKVWATAATLVALALILSIAAYNIADRVGPVRPIVTTSYQAK